MSFKYGQFGTGFIVPQPSREVLQFSDLVETRGEDVTVVLLTETGTDDYEDPVYSESSYTEKAFVERKGWELTVMPGNVKLGDLTVYVVPWAAVHEEGCELEVDGVRYHIASLVEKRSFIKVEAERKVS